ncbi:MAG: VWA domain-containing protein [Acidobacteria bacterium]|nr:VWA domain-containing protein [Acidobacteriota bacterium]MCI0623756.1 VWA domain-containing protein [Acidobacteriota bacterium]MCI0721105.1 VWA domain-containing protein [Acidobacteriota bacterium]
MPVTHFRRMIEQGAAWRPHWSVLGLAGVLGVLFALLDVRFLGWQSSANDSQRAVSLYISILDKDGKPVAGVTKQDIEVLEEKKPQVITALQFEKETPVSLGVLIDISRSMGGEGISLALSWLKSLAERLKSPDELFVNAFSDESQELVDYVSPEDYLEEALDHVGAGGQARMGLAVDLALIKLRDARNQKRALLFFSAGRDIAGPATLDHISKFGFPVYSVGIPGSNGAGGTLDRLKNLNLKGSAVKVYAEHSGGEALFVESNAQAEEALARICLQVKNQYRLDYVSSRNDKPGKMLKVEVKTRNPRWEVRHLKKYPVSSR